MNRNYLVDGFKLDSDRPGDHQIHSVTAIQVDTLIVNGQCDFSSEIYAPQRKFTAHTRLICGF
ncbi:MAG TPA: hypothetical protein VFC29_01045, partial [Candidatus Limnocylindrales bacterium]|nr:hypothetical protein [Candidatus Limnocylindrales bacterium]